MRRAFTLIEVLVVVAIIALLISILLPSLSSARDVARSAKCLANMRNMANGMSTFANTHKGRFQLVTGGVSNTDPYGPVGPDADPTRSIYQYEIASTVAPGQGPALLCWPAALLREAGSRAMTRNAAWGMETDAVTAYASKESMRRMELMMCPSDTLAVGTPFWPLTPAKKNSLRWYGRLSYGLNEDVAGDVTDNGAPVWNAGVKGASPGAGQRLKGVLDKIIRPSEVAMFLDMGLDKPAASGDPVVANTVVTKEARGPLLEFVEARWGRLPAQRHRTGSSLNVTFADGHGGFAKKTVRKPYGTGQYLPEFVYSPKIRVSPYQAGDFPVP